MYIYIYSSYFRINDGFALTRVIGIMEEDRSTLRQVMYLSSNNYNCSMVSLQVFPLALDEFYKRMRTHFFILNGVELLLRY